MLLKSLELHGFKTFPDKTVLTFEKGVTAVVGPNGSGKSNISDAMRWVLGEQSTRALRCSKMEDVIFSGTPQRKAQGYAEVTLTIDNTDRQLNFDGDEVAVSRRFYRSGESEYRLNRTAVRLKDVHELFMDTGLGRDGYSMIGQGKIDSIVSAKSEDRREIFEEAAGISRFRYRKEEAERRLEKAEENLLRLKDILDELEARVGPLKEQAEKAEQFIALDEEKRGLEIGLWVETLNRSGKTLREAEEKIAAADASYREAEASLAAVTEEIEENYNQTNSCTAEMEAARAAAAETDEEATRREGEILVAENDERHLQETAERLKNEREEITRSGEDLLREIEEKRRAVSEKDGEIARGSADLIAFTSELEALRQGTDAVVRQIDAAAAELASLQDEASQHRVRRAEAEASVQEIAGRADSVDTAIAEGEARLTTLQEERETRKAASAENGEKLHAAENAVKGYEMRAESRRKRAAAAKEEADKLRLDAGEEARRAKVLEDLERNLEGFTQSVRAVMREKARGGLRGVRGSVTQILRVPGEYTVALETALGPAMQNVVVDDEPAAKAAIRFLKQRDSGRATFLPLSTVRGTVLQKRELEGVPGFVGIASELCTCAPEYDGIRDFLLGRTAVAEDLDAAAAIAKRLQYRNRVVSLDGQVVNAGGSFTGGSNARNSGLLSRAGEIERIRKKAAALEEKAAAALDRWKEADALAARDAAELEAARGELAALNETKIRLLAEAAQTERELEAAERTLSGLREEKENAAGRMQTQKAAAEKAEAAAAALEEQAAAVRARMEKMSGSRAEQTRRADEMALRLQEMRLNGLALQKDRETLTESIEALQMRREDREARAAALDAEACEVENKIAESRDRAASLARDAAALREEAGETRKKMEAVAARRAALEQRAAELRRAERERSDDRERIGRELARMRERAEAMTKEYDGIVAKLWEEYELTRREAEETGTKITDVPAAQRRLNALKNSIRALGAVNVAAVVEYKEVSERYTFMKTQTEDVERSRAELLKLIQDLTGRMKERFSVQFAAINEQFGKIFRDLFGGGNARLSFTDETDVLTSGIEIEVNPPGKIVSHIELLSGGEKALVAICIYFAIMRVSPPPFCMLDEIEAALDDVNVTRFANYLRRMNDRTQFIAITHRRGTMEEADVLYGVTMQDEGISKLLSLRASEAEEKLGL